jgi:hypothetical protein
MARKIKTVEMPLSLVRKAVRLIRKQQRLLNQLAGIDQPRPAKRGFAVTPEMASVALQNYRKGKAPKGSKKRRKARRSTQPMNAGIGMSGIQMGN